MLDRVAATISVLFSPFLIAMASILLILRVYGGTMQDRLLWIVVAMLFGSVLPMLFILLLFRLGQLNDVRLTVREQRAKPLIFSLVSSLVGTGILDLLNAPMEIIWFGISCVINVVFLTLITQVWKISFHTGVAAGCMTGLASLISSQLFCLFLLLPFISWARVYRNRHTFLQTIVAAPIAFASTAIVLQLSNEATPVVSGAEVVVHDDEGAAYLFAESSRKPGIYEDTDMRPEVGRTYTLEIDLEGESYRAGETLLPVAPIDSIYQQFEKPDSFADGGIRE